jgi:hypothetical protein
MPLKPPTAARCHDIRGVRNLGNLAVAPEADDRIHRAVSRRGRVVDSHPCLARRAWRKRADLSEYSEGIDDILAAARERGDLQRASSISGERGTIPARSTF